MICEVQISENGILIISFFKILLLTNFESSENEYDNNDKKNYPNTHINIKRPKRIHYLNLTAVP